MRFKSLFLIFCIMFTSCFSVPEYIDEPKKIEPTYSMKINRQKFDEKRYIDKIILDYGLIHNEEIENKFKEKLFDFPEKDKIVYYLENEKGDYLLLLQARYTDGLFNGLKCRYVEVKANGVVYNCSMSYGDIVCCKIYEDKDPWVYCNHSQYYSTQYGHDITSIASWWFSTGVRNYGIIKSELETKMKDLKMTNSLLNFFDKKHFSKETIHQLYNELLGIHNKYKPKK